MDLYSTVIALQSALIRRDLQLQLAAIDHKVLKGERRFAWVWRCFVVVTAALAVAGFSTGYPTFGGFGLIWTGFSIFNLRTTLKSIDRIIAEREKVKRKMTEINDEINALFAELITEGLNQLRP